eukprot:m.108493 g.108493  ORF g.108493 m.108493 type:complete len:686 (-) comp15870_c0_seq2:269-2326(-)
MADSAAPRASIKAARTSGNGVSSSKPPTRAGTVPKRGDEENFDEWEEKAPVKPADQLELVDTDLKQEFTRILKANNPYAPDNIVRFSHKDGEYKQTSTVDQTAFLFSMDGNLVHVDSEEARRQKTTARKSVSTATTGTDDQEVEQKKTVQAQSTSTPKEKKEDGDDEDDAKSDGPNRPLRNQFNFSERASQTSNHVHKDRNVQTEPPPRVSFSANATQWEIYDTYVQHLDKQTKKETKKKSITKRVSAKSATRDLGDERSEEDRSLWSAAAKLVQLNDAKKLERMVNQNTFDEVLQDFKYWDDPSDEFRATEGSLLPLWKFSYEPFKKRTVTGLAWSPLYNDQFAASYGSYDYNKQSGGGIAVFSLKNPSAPEFAFVTTSGVMCIDFCPDTPSLLAAGMYDGSIAVYQLLYDDSNSKPIYQSTVKSGKHNDPVWQIKWLKTAEGEAKMFTTVSSDGVVCSWMLVKNELQRSELTRLVSTDETVDKVFALNSGTCFAFKPDDHVFLVGTEEGMVRKCSKAYSSKYLHTFEAHSMAVYALHWNPFDSNVFISCSGDWSVKIWDQNFHRPCLSFDFGSPVGDVAWAPYSSTIFAAVTPDAVYVCDISQDKYEPLCAQPLVRKNKLTHIAFNPIHPIILVGDDHGNVQCLKLSPNLRKVLKDKKPPPADVQAAALNKVLDMCKEGPTTG